MIKEFLNKNPEFREWGQKHPWLLRYALLQGIVHGNIVTFPKQVRIWWLRITNYFLARKLAKLRRS